MKLHLLFPVFLLPVAFFAGCLGTDTCKPTAKSWKKDARQEFETFMEMQEEIELLKNKRSRIFINDLHLRNVETTQQLSLPKIKNWLDRHKYISIEGETVNAQYQVCAKGPITYSANFFYSPEGIRAYDKNLAKVKDSLSLGNGWFYLLTKCDGCGE